jgi:hypothetical protein
MKSGNETNFDTSHYEHVILFGRWQPFGVFCSEAVHFEAFSIDGAKFFIGEENGWVHHRHRTTNIFTQRRKYNYSVPGGQPTHPRTMLPSSLSGGLQLQ